MMLQPTMQLRWLPIKYDDFTHPASFLLRVLQQKWEHPNNVDDEGFPHLGEWRDIGVERE